jgi:hypothetical protein
MKMYPKKFFSSTALKPLTGRCFVIMPFAEEFTAVYQAIKETVEADGVGFICLRADDLLVGGYIMEDVLRGIGESEVIIADLTGRNPNVFYELGITHMVRDVSKIIMITQDIESVPFDLRAFRCIVYKQTTEGISKLKADLLKAIREVAEHTFLIKVKDDERYKFQQKLLGEGKYLYDFELRGFFGFDSGKLELTVTRYGINDPPTVVARVADGLSVGQSIAVPYIPWELRLEEVAPDRTATFCLLRVVNH